MARQKQPWHRGKHQARARKIRDAANANPSTPCQRCGRTLDQHAPHPNGRRPFWTAGHIIDSQVDGLLGPEVSTCNFKAGARRRANAMRGKPLRTRRSQPYLNTSRPW